MHRSSKRWVFLLLALTWAFGAPVFLFRDLGDESVDRRLKAMAVSRLGASPEDYASNARVSIPKGSVDMIQDIAQAEERRASALAAVICVSSCFILVLAIMVFQHSRNERPEA